MVKLRAVGENEPVPTPKITSILDAANRGTRLDELIQMRVRIAKALDDELTSPRDLAALSRRQIEISKEIEALRRQQQEEKQDADTSDEEWSEEAI